MPMKSQYTDEQIIKALNTFSTYREIEDNLGISHRTLWNYRQGLSSRNKQSEIPSNKHISTKPFNVYKRKMEQNQREERYISTLDYIHTQQALWQRNILSELD